MGKLKNSIHENGGFQHWFVNVFWFHYKWAFLVGIVVLAIVVFITVDALRTERYDTSVVIATDYYVDEEALDALDAVLKPAVEDLDGNGKVSINYIVLYLGDTEVGRQNEERMYLYMTEDDVAFYLMSENISDAYTNPLLEYFTDEIAQYDLPADENNAIRCNLSGNTVLAECGIDDAYLSIMDYTTVKGTEEVSDALNTALSMANALIEAGGTGDNSAAEADE